MLLKSFVHLLHVEPGFVTENLLTANIGLVQIQDPQRRAMMQREVINRIAQLPGVQAVGGGTGLPPGDGAARHSLRRWKDYRMTMRMRGFRISSRSALIISRARHTACRRARLH